MTFGDHLEVLRWVFLRSFIIITIFAIAAFLFKDIIYNIIILGPKNDDFITFRLLCRFGNYFKEGFLCISIPDIKLQALEVSEQFRSHLIISVISGLILAVPYIMWEIWRFIRPALNTKEKRGIRGFVFFTSFLFNTGIFFGYFIIVPLVMQFFLNYELSPDIVTEPKLSSYISNVTVLTLSTGLVFQLPLVIYFLSRAGIITPNVLRKRRKYAIIIIVILSAIITPPDFFSQFLLAVPLIGLYEISISLSSRAYKKSLAG